jgi:hypothetical protein
MVDVKLAGALTLWTLASGCGAEPVSSVAPDAAAYDAAAEDVSARDAFPDAAPSKAIACEATPAADFYTRDVGSIASIAPGTPLYCDTYSPGTVPGYVGHRIAYVTTAIVAGTEKKLTATGQLWVPEANAPGPRRVIADTHGATGMLAQCAPSASAQFDRAAMTGPISASVPGAVIVDADYVGLGRDSGLRTSDAATMVTDSKLQQKVQPYEDVSHPYISLEGEGRATIDLVRATRHIEGVDVGVTPRWLVAGVSQGGHAALATGEVWSRGYGADTTLVGVVAGAPGSALEDSTNVTPAIEQALAPMVLGGLALEHPELRPTDFLSTNTLVAFARSGGGAGIVSKCMSSVQAVSDWLSVYSFYGSTIYKKDPATDSTALPILLANSPGHESTKVPIFIGQVEGDPFILPKRTENLVTLERKTNPTSVTYCFYPQAGGTNPANHSAFKWMFGVGPATCTGPDGQPKTASAASFIASAFGGQ